MIADSSSFSFVSTPMFLHIPYFQRNYVWSEDNWEELFDCLIRPGSHFLGSIILKNEASSSKELPTKSVIDGQQRLTTLSILVRALYDTIEPTLDKEDQKNYFRYENQMEEFLKSKKNSRDIAKIKLIPAHVDERPYYRVVNGDLAKTYPLGIDEKLNIERCYQYFRRRLNKESIDTIFNLWDLLTANNENDDSSKILVIIDLNENDNEQVIFDTLNTAGVRLSCSDTVKNALFQRIQDVFKENNNYSSIIEVYDEKWQKVFSDTKETDDYWRSVRSSGRLMKDNHELLLHCVASIKKLFDPEKNNMSELAEIYKGYFGTLSFEECLDFLDELRDYSVLYKEKLSIEKSHQFSYDDKTAMLILILEQYGITTFYPYILGELYQNPEECDEKFTNLAAYIMWHAVCKIPMQNYNKECKVIMNGTSVGELFDNKLSRYDFSLLDGLNDMKKNNIAMLILFCIELKRRTKKQNKTDYPDPKYDFTLEHVMPRTWQDNWNVDILPVYDSNGTVVSNDPTTIRNKAVYAIGNMTLLNSKLNSSISNASFKEKIEGTAKKKGMKTLAGLLIAREDVVNFAASDKYNGIWDERIINERTKSLMKEFEEIWPMPKQ